MPTHAFPPDGSSSLVDPAIGASFSGLHAPGDFSPAAELDFNSAHAVADEMSASLVPELPPLPCTPPIGLEGTHFHGSQRAERKLALLRRAGLFGGDTFGARISRAATLEDLRNAYRLVHSVYLGTGYILPEPAGMRLRIFETTSDTATFVAKVKGSVVGVLSVIGDSRELGLPSDAAFKSELDAMRKTGAKICEVTNQAIAELHRKSALPTEFIRCAVAHGISAGFDEAVATVSPSHRGFYELLGFRQIGGERSYSGKIHDPVIAMSLDVNRYRHAVEGGDGTERFIHQFLSRENHYLLYVGEWDRQARRHFLDADLLQQLFVKDRAFLAECSAMQLSMLQRRWGQELFSAVTGGMFLPLANMRDEMEPWPSEGSRSREVRTRIPAGQKASRVLRATRPRTAVAKGSTERAGAGDLAGATRN